MSGAVRSLLVTILTTALIGLPSRAAFAVEAAVEPAAAPAPASAPALSATVAQGALWNSALAVVPSEARLMRQVVASTNESKMLIGLGASGAVVGGLGMIAYGASSSCKGKAGNSTTTCERVALVGAVALAGGAMTLVLWALSR